MANIVNRKARFNYEIDEEFEAGIVLLGSEVKSIREARANISDAYVVEKSNELFLINAHISEYPGANRYNHEPLRPKKLLLHKKQLVKIAGKITKEGYSAIPLSIYFKKRFAKVMIGIGKGKKLYDKREAIKKREEDRKIRRREEI